MLFWYKMYLAQQQQFESTSMETHSELAIAEEIRQNLASVRQIPSITAAVLSAAGKIESNGQIYHSTFPDFPRDGTLEQQYWHRILQITPDSIRALVRDLADPAVAAEFRHQFIEHNSLLGAHYVNDVLQNPEDIWPEFYDVEMISEDIHCYNNVLTSVGTRLPHHFLTVIDWSGSASDSRLLCSYPCPTRIDSRFDVVQVQPGARRRRRDAYGNMIEAGGAQFAQH